MEWKPNANSIQPSIKLNFFSLSEWVSWLGLVEWNGAVLFPSAVASSIKNFQFFNCGVFGYGWMAQLSSCSLSFHPSFNYLYLLVQLILYQLNYLLFICFIGNTKRLIDGMRDSWLNVLIWLMSEWVRWNGLALAWKPITFYAVIKRINYLFFYEGGRAVQPFHPPSSINQSKKFDCFLGCVGFHSRESKIYFIPKLIPMPNNTV